MFDIFLMIYFILFIGCLLIFNQTNASNHTEFCEICIVDSKCTDDAILFNVSISKECQTPLDTHFTYYTDINSRPNHYNMSGACSDCFIIIEIEPTQDAWDYTLSLKLPQPSGTCRTDYTVHCVGQTSGFTWYVLGSLSGLTIILGIFICFVRQYRGTTKEVVLKKKEMVISAINV